jgi:hypothetical protein
VIEVHGRRGRGAARDRSGRPSCAPHVASWARRGRAPTGEPLAGGREGLQAGAAATICRRAVRTPPAGHGPVSLRIDSAYHALELPGARLTVPRPRGLEGPSRRGRACAASAPRPARCPGARAPGA